MNNAGDPYINGSYTPNTKVVERAVLKHFAGLFKADLEEEEIVPLTGPKY